jgi:hypothetical protein
LPKALTNYGLKKKKNPKKTHSLPTPSKPMQEAQVWGLPEELMYQAKPGSRVWQAVIHGRCRWLLAEDSSIPLATVTRSCGLNPRKSQDFAQ